MTKIRFTQRYSQHRNGLKSKNLLEPERLGPYVLDLCIRIRQRPKDARQTRYGLYCPRSTLVQPSYNATNRILAMFF